MSKAALTYGRHFMFWTYDRNMNHFVNICNNVCNMSDFAFFAILSVCLTLKIVLYSFKNLLCPHVQQNTSELPNSVSEKFMNS